MHLPSMTITRLRCNAPTCTCLQDLSISASGSQGDSSGAGPAGPVDAKRAAKQYAAVFDALLGHGFKPAHVETVLKELPLVRGAD